MLFLAQFTSYSFHADELSTGAILAVEKKNRTESRVHIREHFIQEGRVLAVVRRPRGIAGPI